MEILLNFPNVFAYHKSSLLQTYRPKILANKLKFLLRVKYQAMNTLLSLLLFTVGMSVCKAKTFQHWKVFANRRGDEGGGDVMGGQFSMTMADSVTYQLIKSIHLSSQE